MTLIKAVNEYIDIVKLHNLDELCCLVIPDNPKCSKPCSNYKIAKKKIKRSMKTNKSNKFLDKLNDIADNVDSLIQYINDENNSKHHQHIIGGYIETIHCQVYELTSMHKEKKSNG
jgi:hypothetical protein